MIQNIVKSSAPIPVKIIAWYFLLDGFANIVNEIISISIQYNRPILHNFRFLYESLPGILSNDPFSHGVIVATPSFGIFAFIQSLSIISILLFTGYKLLRMEKQGWLLGIYIVASGLLFSTIIYNNPASYVENIFGGIGIYGVLSKWTVMSIVFLINIFALIYLPTHKKLFENQVSGQKITLKNYVLIGMIFIVTLPLSQIISRYFPSSTYSTVQPTIVADETANWKTYAAKTFSIKYDKEYSYLESTTSVKFEKTTGRFNIAVAKNVKSLTLDNALGNGSYLSYTKDALAGKDIKRITIDNVNAVLVEDLNVGQSGVSFDIITIKGSDIYQLVSEGITYQDFIQILSTFKFTTQTFKSEKGSFAIDLPSDMKMTERSERVEGGVTKGEVWFTFGQFDEHAPSGLVVTYGKPVIEGKGGACFDEKTGAGYKEEMIAGQKVQVCEISGFSAQYFTHQSKKIEYGVHAGGLRTEQLETVSEAVRKTLRFE